MLARQELIKKRIEKEDIQIEYRLTEDMLADIMTKSLQGNLFQKIRDQLPIPDILDGVTSSVSSVRLRILHVALCPNVSIHSTCSLLLSKYSSWPQRNFSTLITTERNDTLDDPSITCLEPWIFYIVIFAFLIQEFQQHKFAQFGMPFRNTLRHIASLVKFFCKFQIILVISNLSRIDINNFFFIRFDFDALLKTNSSTVSRTSIRSFFNFISRAN